MKISLYIPCFNSEKTIAACLDSVLLQEFPLNSILVVDDGSTDKSAEIAAKYPVKIIRHNKNRGLACARNTALKAINSEFVASLDADCVARPDWLRQLTKGLKSPLVAGSGGRLLETQASSVFDLWRSVHMKQDWQDLNVQPPFLFGSNTVFRRQVLIDCGLYNEEFKSNYEDVDICNRLKNSGYTISYRPEACVEHRKKDSLYSLFNTFWRWNFEFYLRQDYYSTEDKLVFKLNDNLGLANRFLEEDKKSKRSDLFYLDFLLAVHHSLKDFEYYISHGNPKQSGNQGLSFWLSLLDLTLFYHLHPGKVALKSIVPGNNKIIQNFLALNLVLGQQIREIFKDEKIQRIIYKHLLFSLYGTNDPYLLDKIFNLVILHKDWSGLCDRNHPYLEQAFLKNLFFFFRKWMRERISNSDELIKSIEISAKMTDKAIGECHEN